MVKLNDLAILKSDQLLQLFSATDLDAALDAAARKSSAVVAEFTATVADAEIDAPIAIEAAVEFLIPPESIGLFIAEFDDQLMRRSLGYAASVTIVCSGHIAGLRKGNRLLSRTIRFSVPSPS